jgi:hypothetical protein
MNSTSGRQRIAGLSSPTNGPTTGALRSAAVNFRRTPRVMPGLGGTESRRRPTRQLCVGGWMARVVTPDNVQLRVSARSLPGRGRNQVPAEQLITPMPIAVCSASSAGTPTLTASRFTLRSPCLASPLAGKRGIRRGSHGGRCSTRRKCRAKIQVPARLAPHVTTTARGDASAEAVTGDQRWRGHSPASSQCYGAETWRSGFYSSLLPAGRSAAGRGAASSR